MPTPRKAATQRTANIQPPAATPLTGGLAADDDSLLVDITQLQPWPGNARRGDVELIAESIGEHGQYVPLVVQRSTGYVLKGSHTLAALERRGRSQAAVVYVDVDEDQARRIVLMDNASSDHGNYHLPDLAVQLTMLGGVYTGSGYKIESLDQIANSLEKAALPTGPTAPLRSDRTKMIVCPSCAHQFDSTAAVEVRTPSNAGGRA